MFDDDIEKMIRYMGRICKWFFLQILLFFLTPYLWERYSGTYTLILIFIYTTLYAVYWEYTPKEKRFNRILYPYFAYSIIAVILNLSISHWTVPIWFYLLLPLYGVICVIGAKLFRKYFKRVQKKYKLGWIIYYSTLGILFAVLKSFCVSWMCPNKGTIESEKQEILERKNYLLDKLITTPNNVLNKMPTAIGTQFQGEWALYSCSMFAAALVNISYLSPETRKENIHHIDCLIDIVTSPEIRYYDTMRWKEDPLENLAGDKSHISYLSHLAWMICGYKEIGGDDKYDVLLSLLCEAMNRRLLKSKCLNLPTYPGESIYIPDVLVAIVALNKYADMHNEKYRSTVKRWIKCAKQEWIDGKTGLLVSFLQEDGKQFIDIPIKGSYSSLNCYYLTFIDENFAKAQYERLKLLFWKEGFISGLKEYYDRTCYVGMDIDAGPIIFELSPSGTAFIAGASTYFEDKEVRKQILTTAEVAGHTIKWNNQRHYLLANIALVGESIMLAMRTHAKHK